MSERSASRRLILVALMLLLVGAVVIDRVGLLRTAESVPASQRYALAKNQLELQRELLDSADAVEEETERLQRAWDRVKLGLVSASTIELAPSALRDRVRRELNAAGIRDHLVLSEDVRGEVPSGSAMAAVPMRIRVSFDAEDSDTLYRAIERIEQSREFYARVGEISLRGGGLNEVAQRVTATLTIDTVALIGEGG